MAKIDMDKYYTPDHIVDHCIARVGEIIGFDNVTHIVEPSAGAGAFSLKLDCDAYDLEPEHESVARQDFLELDLGYKPGRLFIGNPPFGRSSSLARKFYNRSVEMGDYIAFILPVGQYRNTRSYYKFDLIHTEILPTVEYSGRKVRCCFNIYRRPDCWENGRPKLPKLDGVEVREYNRSTDVFDISEYDYGFVCFGNPSGMEITRQDERAGSLHFKFSDKIRDECIEFLRSINWDVEYPNNTFSGRNSNINKWMVVDQLKLGLPHLFDKDNAKPNT